MTSEPACHPQIAGRRQSSRPTCEYSLIIFSDQVRRSRDKNNAKTRNQKTATGSAGRVLIIKTTTIPDSFISERLNMINSKNNSGKTSNNRKGSNFEQAATTAEKRDWCMQSIVPILGLFLLVFASVIIYEIPNAASTDTASDASMAVNNASLFADIREPSTIGT
jgi:hypothetical protein